MSGSMTAEELFELPEDNWRHELVDGWFYSSITPDLVAAEDLIQKILAWLDAGVRLVRVVYPDTQSIAVYRPGGVGTMHRGADATLSGEDVFPGFSAQLGVIFC